MADTSRRRYLAALAGANLGLSGCLDAGVPFLADPRGRLGRFPDLLVLAGGETDGANLHRGRRLRHVAYDSASGTYRDRAVYRSDSITSFDRYAKGFVATELVSESRSRIVSLGSGMNVRTETEVSGRHVLTADADHVYSTAEMGFSVYDRRLTRVGWDGLPEDYRYKHMEDVVLHDDVAYVVDDVYKPMFLFRVDVSRPSAPSYLEAVEFGGVGPKLGQQWLDPPTNRWGVLLWTTSRAGTYQHVLTTPMTGAPTGSGEGDVPERSTEAVTTTEIASLEGESGPARGTAVDDVTAKPPVYAAINTAGDDGRHLAAVEVADDGSVSFDRRAPLAGPPRVVAGDGTVLALTVGPAPEIVVYDVDRSSVVHRQDLDVTEPLAVQAVR